MARTKLHEMARRYAEAGIPVFPIRVGAKEPAYKGSFHNATCDPDEIDRLWAIADWNIGLEPEQAGWAIVDIDDLATWENLDEHKPDTYTVQTPSGGRHLYFRGSVGGSASRLAHGVDTRGRGSYVLVPPSSVSGSLYTVVNAQDPTPLPAWISVRLGHAERIKATAPAEVAFDDPETLTWAVGEIKADLGKNGIPLDGEASDERTYRFINRLVDGRHGSSLSPETLVALLKEHWCPHFDEDWIERKVDSAQEHRQNPPGCGQLSDPERKYADLDLSSLPVESDEPRLASAAGRRPRKISWLWGGWLARGKMHILAGEKGVGKSTLLYDFLATVTSGGAWPDGTQAEVGNVVVWSSEDDFDDTILPRFLAAGGNPAKLFPVEMVVCSDGVERHFDPAHDMAYLLREIRKLGNVAAILIDPIVSAVTGDSHKNAETRRGLQPLVDLAEDCGAALIGITHFTKGTEGRNPVDRVTGSLAFAAIARIVLCAAADENGQQRRLVRAAANIGINGGGFGYTLHQAPLPEYDMAAQRVAWGARLQGTARELLGDNDTQDQTTKAVEFITTMLADGPVSSKEMREAASALGHAWRTVERARDKMPWVIIERREGAWHWRNTAATAHDMVEY